MYRLIFVVSIFFLLSSTANAAVKRHPLPNNSTYPIASAVEVPADSTILFHSGVIPAPANKDAELGTSGYYGDTKTQAISVFEQIKKNLKSQGLTMGDIVKLTVFLVPDPANDNKMDFKGFMEAYTQYFGTKEQPNLPARSAVQIGALVKPLMFIEVEAFSVRP